MLEHQEIPEIVLIRDIANLSVEDVGPGRNFAVSTVLADPLHVNVEQADKASVGGTRLTLPTTETRNVGLRNWRSVSPPQPVQTVSDSSGPALVIRGFNIWMIGLNADLEQTTNGEGRGSWGGRWRCGGCGRVYSARVVFCGTHRPRARGPRRCTRLWVRGILHIRFHRSHLSRR